MSIKNTNLKIDYKKIYKTKEDIYDIIVDLVDCRTKEYRCMCFHCEKFFKLGLHIVNKTFRMGNFFCEICAEKELSKEDYVKVKKVLCNEKNKQKGEKESK